MVLEDLAYFEAKPKIGIIERKYVPCRWEPKKTKKGQLYSSLIE